MNKQLRNKIAAYIFHYEHRNHKRNQKTVPYSEAKRIGILYDSTNEKNYEVVKNFVKDIRSQQKDVLALGFYNARELPAARFVKLGLDFFTTKTLNWHLKPHSRHITNFMNLDFDIL